MPESVWSCIVMERYWDKRVDGRVFCLMPFLTGTSSEAATMLLSRAIFIEVIHGGCGAATPRSVKPPYHAEESLSSILSARRITEINGYDPFRSGQFIRLSESLQPVVELYFSGKTFLIYSHSEIFFP